MYKNRDKIFISSVTEGLLPYRKLARDIVDAQGFTPVVEESFELPTTEMVELLREKIFDCKAMLAIVGPYPGSSAGVTHEEQELAYAQFELKYAVTHRKPCVAMITGPNFSPDSSDDKKSRPIPTDTGGKRLQQDAYIKQLKEKIRGVGWMEFENQFDFVFKLAKHRWHPWIYGREYRKQ